MDNVKGEMKVSPLIFIFDYKTFSMKKIIISLLVFSFTISYSNIFQPIKENSTISSLLDCGTIKVKGKTKSLYKGPKGGCYYINDSGNKSYVDRNKCKC